MDRKTLRHVLEKGIWQAIVQIDGGAMPPESDFYHAAVESYETTPKKVGSLTLLKNTPTLDAWWDEKDSILLAVRGTADSRDLKADASLVINRLADTQRYKQDKETMEELLRDYPPQRFDYYITGHSLGGAIATQLKHDFPFIREAVLYNSAFQPKDFKRQKGEKRYYTKDDFLYKLGGRFFRNVTVVPTSSLGNKYIDTVRGHLISSFKSLYEGSNVASDVKMRGGVSPEEKREYEAVLFRIEAQIEEVENDLAEMKEHLRLWKTAEPSEQKTREVTNTKRVIKEIKDELRSLHDEASRIVRILFPEEARGGSFTEEAGNLYREMVKSHPLEDPIRLFDHVERDRGNEYWVDRMIGFFLQNADAIDQSQLLGPTTERVIELAGERDAGFSRFNYLFNQLKSIKDVIPYAATRSSSPAGRGYSPIAQDMLNVRGKGLYQKMLDDKVASVIRESINAHRKRGEPELLNAHQEAINEYKMARNMIQNLGSKGDAKTRMKEKEAIIEKTLAKVHEILDRIPLPTEAKPKSFEPEDEKVAFDPTQPRGKGMTYREQFMKQYGLEDKGYSLKEISSITKVPQKILREVYNRGVGAYKTQPSSVRLNTSFVKNVKAPMKSKLSKEQWAMARVYSFVMGNPEHDNDLRENRGGVSDAFEKKIEGITCKKNGCTEYAGLILQKLIPTFPAIPVEWMPNDIQMFVEGKRIRVTRFGSYDKRIKTKSGAEVIDPSAIGLPLSSKGQLDALQYIARTLQPAMVFTFDGKIAHASVIALDPEENQFYFIDPPDFNTDAVSMYLQKPRFIPLDMTVPLSEQVKGLGYFMEIQVYQPPAGSGGPWIEALKEWNRGKEAWCIPRKGSQKSQEVRDIAARLKAPPVKRKLRKPVPEVATVEIPEMPVKRKLRKPIL